MQAKPVYLAMTRPGLLIALELASHTQCEVWCGADAISEAEYEGHSGTPLTRFNYVLAQKDTPILQRALATVAEHHPGQEVLIEVQCQNESTVAIEFHKVHLTLDQDTGSI
jgi:hypothetical protein